MEEHIEGTEDTIYDVVRYYDDADDIDRVVTEDAVRVGDMVIAVVNGSICVHKFGDVPDAVNFGPYMVDGIDHLRANGHDVALLRFDEGTRRYQPVPSHR